MRLSTNMKSSLLPSSFMSLTILTIRHQLICSFEPDLQLTVLMPEWPAEALCSRVVHPSVRPSVCPSVRDVRYRTCKHEHDILKTNELISMQISKKCLHTQIYSPKNRRYSHSPFSVICVASLRAVVPVRSSSLSVGSSSIF